MLKPKFSPPATPPSAPRMRLFWLNTCKSAPNARSSPSNSRPRWIHGGKPTPKSKPTYEARAEYVETEDEEISPFVFVDEESGWLIVWASEDPETPSI